jgi:hypothetical protein
VCCFKTYGKPEEGGAGWGGRRVGCKSICKIAYYAFSKNIIATIFAFFHNNVDGNDECEVSYDNYNDEITIVWTIGFSRALGLDFSEGNKGLRF